MLMVQLACPKCGFVIEQYRADQLETDVQKQKRYQYLRKKQTLCPNCLTQTAKLEERRVEVEAVPEAAPLGVVEAEGPPEAPRAAEAHGPTPLSDELEQGPWPSHVTELKKSAYHLQMYEESLSRRQTQWGFGGYVSLPGVAAGILVRASARPEIAKGANFIRVLPPAGSFYSTKTLGTVCDIADRYAYGLLHLHSTGGNIEILGIPTEKLKEAVSALNVEGLDVGSTGDAFRNTVECVGPARCDVSLIDTLRIREAWYRGFLDDVQYPRFPHKLKVKISGCPNDCTRAVQKACIALIGVFRDAPRINREELATWVGEGGDIAHIARMCPARAMAWDGQRLAIDQEACTHCMYCINKCPAIRPGDNRGVAVLVGGKLRGKYGPLLGRVLVPFVPLTPPAYTEVFDIIHRIGEVFDEHARRKERLGDFLYRIGIDEFSRLVGVEPSPYQMAEPRSNVFYHWAAGEPEGGAKEA